MPLLKRDVLVSVEEYLEGEKHSQVKHEYVRGRVYAMVGASKAHNRIALNIGYALDRHLRGGPCNVFVSDIKVHIGEIFYYPDVSVTCSPLDTDPFISTEPSLIVEVLSPTTEAVDRLDKRLAYQSLPSLREYALVSQDRREVQIYRRREQSWDLEVFQDQDTVRFESIDFELPLAEVYRDVVL
jgi:Uma2 family endonuclease